MFRRLSSDLRALAGPVPARLAEPVRPRSFFYVVVWHPSSAPGVWCPLNPSAARYRGFRSSADAERAARKAAADFPGLVAVQEGDAAYWSACKRFGRARAL